MSASARQQCPASAAGSIPNIDSNVYRYPPGVGATLDTAGRMIARGTLRDSALEELVRVLVRDVPQQLRGDSVAAMIRDAHWSRDDEIRRQYDAEIAVVRYARKELKWGREPAEIAAGALALAAGHLTETDVAGLLRGCWIDHAERIKRLQPVPARARR